MHSIFLHIKSWVYISLSIVWYYCFHRKFIRTTDQKVFWEKRTEQDFNAISQVDTDPYYQKLDEFVINRLSHSKSGAILEVGCHFGYRLGKFSKELPTREFFGVDLGETNLQYGQNHLPSLSDLSLINANAVNLPFSDQSFETVYTVVSLTHMDFNLVDQAISEIIRVCRNQLLLIEVDNRPMSVLQRLKILGWSYGYMHKYEKLVGNRLELTCLTPLFNQNHHPSYTAFEFQRIQH